MPAPVSLFGIRHHGPGSARRLVEALDALSPAAVLIEGPSDASDLIPALADPRMVMPAAILSYAQDDPSRAVFFPFAEYSPERQAALWAIAHGVEVRFIDLPTTDRLGDGPQEGSADPLAPADPDPISYDPIGTLARAAGYEDGESWWSDVIEHNPTPGPIFEAVADAMTALRAETAPPEGREAAREAFMRLEIAETAKRVNGPVAVVCGAWHVPALAEKHSLADDKAILRGRPKTKTRTTWSPWTSPRLASMSGYGAGVSAPGWFAHLWRHGDAPDRDAHWLVRVAGALRTRGHAVSTASLIEAERLTRALATLRERPAAGFEEMQEAIVSVFCDGDPALWHEVSFELLVGTEVGEIPPDVALAPLLEDLQRQQKAVRLKPEDHPRELTLDLRSAAGLARSTLLHRLTVLGVPWGVPAAAGGSRGTFRENWTLRWVPEFSVALVENLVHGATIAEAADGKTLEAMRGAGDVAELARMVRDAMTADLPRAIAFGIAQLEEKAGHDADCLPMLLSLAPMADVIRYGEARPGQSAPLEVLMPRMAVRAALALHHAIRNLDAEAAAAMRSAILSADDAIRLAALGDDVHESWLAALSRIPQDAEATPLIVGTAARLLYEAGSMDAEATSLLLARSLSPGIPVASAAGFFEGFFQGAGSRLIHDEPLRRTVDAWMAGLEEEDFVASLPLFRRVFSSLDAMERRRLMEALFDARPKGARAYAVAEGSAGRWPDVEASILSILSGATA